ncbi:GNAT family N-acetyltransferase [Lactobacillus sp. S2-2]|uniref:GNAT family N-acetyltransferase n=1 Tax=Lactobacillus sp. S2-2 TaxID=2692917 RepID=UPI001F012E9C|nr:GNAT family N-acetyltransferase [Lactobacillus sp. S2-2]
MLTKQKINEQNYELAINIWEESVTATHDFLKQQDKEEIKRNLPFYLKQVNGNYWLNNNEIIGFSGIDDDKLEMLFLHPNFFKQGLGSKIIQQLINQDQIKYVDVNKDNTNATKFYLKNGFEQYDESETDGQGNDYPILHLKLNN